MLSKLCPECGFDAGALGRADIGPRLLRAVADLRTALAGTRVTTRPAPEVWSTLEYGCHVRDVCRIFAERLQSMLTSDHPLFANWDQDRTAQEDGYGDQDPATVGRDLERNAQLLAAHFAAVRGADWDRTGARSDGARFTVATLGQYLVHDPVHHVFDVTGIRQST